MTTEKSKNQIITYLEQLDKDKLYVEFPVFVSELNKRIIIPIRIKDA